jgi:hypothetical protein
MIWKEAFRQIAYHQKVLFTAESETVERELLGRILPFMDDRQMIVLTGIRGCGKSTLLKQLSRTQKNWCYFNFKDERLQGFRTEDFEMLHEVLLEVYGSDECCFFDEIQHIEKFEIVLRQFQDEGKKVVVTSSNASLLSRALKTRLAGRYLVFELYPFSFREFLDLKKIKTAPDDLILTGKGDELITALTSYMILGGFPENIKNEDTGYIRTLYESIFYQDVLILYSSRRERSLKELIILLTRKMSYRFSYSEMNNVLGLNDWLMVKRYIRQLLNAYLFFELTKYPFPVKRRQSSFKKMYLIDPAMFGVCDPAVAPDKERLLKNIVFNELQRQGKEVTYYFRDKYTCDFITRNKDNTVQAIQVCYSFEEKTNRRELSALRKAMDYCHADNGVMITWEQAGEISAGTGTITIMPAWKWMVEN